jgi:uncharacterized membrane protein
MEITKQETKGWPPKWAVTLLGVALLILGVLGLLASPFAILASPFLFDAPGSDQNPLVFALLAGMLLLPVASIVAIVASWLAARRGSRVALAIAGASVLGWIVYMASVSSALDDKCGGQLSCPPADGNR